VNLGPPPTPYTGYFKTGVSINAGRIIGVYTQGLFGVSRAFTWTAEDGAAILPGLGSFTSPTGLNGSGQIVGNAVPVGGFSRAVLWQPSPGLANTLVGEQVTVTPEDPATGTAPARVDFAQVIAAGQTTLTITQDGPPPPSGFSLGSPPTFFEITTSALVASPIRVCLSYAGMAFPDPDLIRLLHYENGAWSDVTTSLDTVAEEVCGVTTTLSPFAMAVPVAPTYTFTGLFPPVANAPTLNVVKAGSAVPLKFSLGGDMGLAVFETGYPMSRRVECEAGSTIDLSESTNSAGGHGLAYDPETQQYIYVWKTDSAWKGTCRSLTIRLDDGTERIVRFQLR
jgi:hypothetical protein